MASIPSWLIVALGLPTYLALVWLMVRLLFISRARLRCPLGVQEASVLFLNAPDGSRADVLRCSLLTPSQCITCPKTCLHPAY